MTDMSVFVDSLTDNDYTETTNRLTAHGAQEFSREKGGVIEVVTIHFNETLVAKQRFNGNGTSIDYAEVNASQSGKQNLALRLTH